jgi:DNA polymerase
MDDLTKEVISCTKCKLCKSRTHAVPGKGDIHSDIMFVGEAPGENEDKKGIPFCGASGNFLEKMLESINMKRTDVYITNIVKCRPPRNRDPEEEEIESCKEYLERQIDLIKPKVICTLGRYSLHYFYPEFVISKVHGKIYSYKEVKLIPLYHPAVGLYRDSMKKVLLDDFKIIKEAIVQNLTTKQKEDIPHPPSQGTFDLFP